MDTRINGTNVILVPYQEKHVTKYVLSYIIFFLLYISYMKQLILLMTHIKFIILYLDIMNG